MLFLLLFLLWTITNAQQNNENNKILKCRSGFLLSSKVEIIPPERINDGYCDCPHDGGVDEPHTEACSGASMGGWAGINTASSNNKMVACPHQPSLILPVSRIHDGICDCCSGADEGVLKKCPDVCEEVLREERERRRVLEENFKIGWTKRQEALREFQNVVQETTAKLEQLQKQHAGIQRTLDQVEVELSTLKRNALQKRVTLVQTTLMSEGSLTSSLLEPLTNEQLLKLIIQTCQVAGEIGEGKQKTCIPLRLAGLDVAGIVWGDEDLARGTVDEWQRFENHESNEWADAMDRRLAGEDNWWSSSTSNTNTKKQRHPRRRLQQQEEDEDDWDEEEEYNDHHHYGDDDEYDPYDDDYDYDGTPPETTTTTTMQPERNEDIATEIQKQAFYATRVAFLNRASELIAKIDDMMKQDEEGEEDNEKKEEDESKSNSIDPMAFQMVRSNLRRRQEAIQRGLDYAVSAHVLTKMVEDNRQDLMALAAGTLYHSNIRALDVWQIVASLQLPEYDPKSCASSLCPPAMQEENGGVLYPPGPIVEAAREFCKTVDTDNSCSDNTNDIPTSIPDNYYGYVPGQARDSNDPLSRSFAPLDNYNTDRTQLSQLNSRKDELQDKQRALADEIHQLEEQMGGRDHAKFGHDGELYSIRDSCSAVQEGKYQYEVCLFGRATQKEDGSSETFLGKWNAMKYAPETGLRIMEWTKGTKCWNGPQRSATVIVTCGPDATKVLSAEEPDTCRYVLEMESYIACDETYKQRYGL